MNMYTYVYIYIFYMYMPQQEVSGLYTYIYISVYAQLFKLGGCLGGSKSKTILKMYIFLSIHMFQPFVRVQKGTPMACLIPT